MFEKIEVINISDILCISIVDFVLNNASKYDSLIDVYNAYINKHGNNGVTIENIHLVIAFLKDVLETDRQLLSSSLAIDQKK